MKKISSERLAGILITVSIHLAVIIVLLITVVEPSITKDRNAFEMDFTKQDEIEKLEKELAKAKAANERVEKRLREAGVSRQEVKNLAVNRESLKDDKGLDGDKLYREHERVMKQYREVISTNDKDYVAVSEKKPETKKKKDDVEYKGPSVLSYELKGRRLSVKKIPAYLCEYDGEVTVIVTVNPQGSVIDARIDKEVSTSIPCLCDAAKKAAYASVFSQKSDAPARQTGYITYRFISQY